MKEKLFNRICPKCGELYIEQQVVKANIGSGAQINMRCENNHKWTEFYSLTYQGFWWDGKRYNSFGEEKTNDR